MRLCLKCKQIFSSEGWVCTACGYEPRRLYGFEAHAPEFADEGGGFKPEYFAELATLEATNFWFLGRNKLIMWALSAYKPDVHTFMEIGCGTGFVLSGIAKACPGVKLSGSEIFMAGLSYAAKRVPSARFMQMDARHVPFIDEFDVIGAFDVIEHIKEDEAVLFNMYQAVRPGGVLILTVPQHQWLWSATDEYACHQRRYSAIDLHRKVESAGFHIIRSTSFVTSLLPAMFFSRLFQKKSVDKEFDAMSEFRLPHWLNVFFGQLLSLELALIKRGVNFPVGGSRLIVAKKMDKTET